MRIVIAAAGTHHGGDADKTETDSAATGRVKAQCDLADAVQWLRPGELAVPRRHNLHVERAHRGNERQASGALLREVWAWSGSLNHSLAGHRPEMRQRICTNGKGRFKIEAMHVREAPRWLVKASRAT